MGSRRHPRLPDHDWTATAESGVIGVDGPGVRLTRAPVRPDTGGWLGAGVWCEWAVPDGQARRVTLLPYPVPHLLRLNHRLLLCGALGTRLTAELTGSGRAFALALRPGGLLALFGHRDAATLTDHAIPAARWIGSTRASALGEAIDAAASPSDKTAAVQARLALPAPGPDRDTELRRARDLIESVLHPDKNTRVRDAAARHSLSIRSLQRLFRTHLGMGPKAAKRRCRLLTAAAALTRQPDSWPRVGPQLGYFDQPHFINDFSRTFGLTPAAFAAQCRRAESDRASPRRAVRGVFG